MFPRTQLFVFHWLYAYSLLLNKSRSSLFAVFARARAYFASARTQSSLIRKVITFSRFGHFKCFTLKWWTLHWHRRIMHWYIIIENWYTYVHLYSCLVMKFLCIELLYIVVPAWWTGWSNNWSFCPFLWHSQLEVLEDVIRRDYTARRSCDYNYSLYIRIQAVKQSVSIGVQELVDSAGNGRFWVLARS